MRARGPLVDEGRGDAASGLGEREERAHLGRGGEGEGGAVCYSGPVGFGVMFDFVFLFIEFMFAEEVIDRFIVLLLWV